MRGVIILLVFAVWTRAFSQIPEREISRSEKKLVGTWLVSIGDKKCRDQCYTNAKITYQKNGTFTRLTNGLHYNPTDTFFEKSTPRYGLYLYKGKELATRDIIKKDTSSMDYLSEYKIVWVNKNHFYFIAKEASENPKGYYREASYAHWHRIK